MKSAICTLFEGHYHYGVGALANSLYQNGFRGVVWAGYRGDLPPWAKPLKQCESFQEFEVAEGCVIRFVPLPIPVHLNNYKAEFMLSIYNCLDPSIDALIYCDPDIVLIRDWTMLEAWVGYGVALCQDINWNMPYDHFRRMAWLAKVSSRGYQRQRLVNYYYNAGFIGVRRQELHFLEVWKDLMNFVSVDGADMTKMALYSDIHPHYIHFDQDLLNIAVMVTDCPLSAWGADGMQFTNGWGILSHAANSIKPWRKNFLLNALRGFSPTLPDRAFLSFTLSPINLYSPMTKAYKRIMVYCASAISRIYRKP